MTELSYSKISFDSSLNKSHSNLDDDYIHRKVKTLNPLDDYDILSNRNQEDIEFAARLNKNPRVRQLTKAEMLRSKTFLKPEKLPPIENTADIKLIKSKQDVTLKLFNKIVQEYSGDKDFGKSRAILEKKLVLMPKRVDMAVYDQVADLKTITYGHRRKSASLIFNPGTMKLREKGKDPVKNVGLPVDLLKQLLQAPKPHNKANTMSVISNNTGIDSHHQLLNDTNDPHDLFVHDSTLLDSISLRKSSQNLKSNSTLKKNNSSVISQQKKIHHLPPVCICSV